MVGASPIPSFFVWSLDFRKMPIVSIVFQLRFDCRQVLCPSEVIASFAIELDLNSHVVAGFEKDARLYQCSPVRICTLYVSHHDDDMLGRQMLLQ